MSFSAAQEAGAVVAGDVAVRQIDVGLDVLDGFLRRFRAISSSLSRRRGSSDVAHAAARARRPAPTPPAPARRPSAWRDRPCATCASAVSAPSSFTSTKANGSLNGCSRSIGSCTIADGGDRRRCPSPPPTRRRRRRRPPSSRAAARRRPGPATRWPQIVFCSFRPARKRPDRLAGRVLVRELHDLFLVHGFNRAWRAHRPSRCSPRLRPEDRGATAAVSSPNICLST